MLTLPVAAYAQYVWLDEKGVKQYSDMAPGPSVPQSRILKQPGNGKINPTGTATTGATADAKSDGKTPEIANTAKAPLSNTEKNTDFLKRKMEQDEKDKKTAELAKQAADKAKACERMRAYSKGLDNGLRISQIDKNGERSFLTDEQRENEKKETQAALGNCN